MRLRSWALASGLILPVLLAACASTSLDMPLSDGIVVVEARVVVKCLDTGYANQAFLQRPDALPFWNDGKDLALLVRGGHGGGRGRGGYDYREPPCVDEPWHFAAETNIADSVWLESAGGQIVGRSRDGLLVVNRVPPGDWRVASLRFNFSFGGLVYVTRLPAPAYRTASIPEILVHVTANHAAYAGVLTVLATRDVAYRDAISVSYQYDRAAELTAWKRVLDLYTGTRLEGTIRERIAELER